MKTALSGILYFLLSLAACIAFGLILASANGCAAVTAEQGSDLSEPMLPAQTLQQPDDCPPS